VNAIDHPGLKTGNHAVKKAESKKLLLCQKKAVYSNCCCTQIRTAEQADTTRKKAEQADATRKKARQAACYCAKKKQREQDILSAYSSHCRTGGGAQSQKAMC